MDLNVEENPKDAILHAALLGRSVKVGLSPNVAVMIDVNVGKGNDGFVRSLRQGPQTATCSMSRDGELVRVELSPKIALMVDVVVSVANEGFLRSISLDRIRGETGQRELCHAIEAGLGHLHGA